jgi:hypothetical protein
MLMLDKMIGSNLLKSYDGPLLTDDVKENIINFLDDDSYSVNYSKILAKIE